MKKKESVNLNVGHLKLSSKKSKKKKVEEEEEEEEASGDRGSKSGKGGEGGKEESEGSEEGGRIRGEGGGKKRTRKAFLQDL